MRIRTTVFAVLVVLLLAACGRVLEEPVDMPVSSSSSTSQTEVEVVEDAAEDVADAEAEVEVVEDDANAEGDTDAEAEVVDADAEGEVADADAEAEVADADAEAEVAEDEAETVVVEGDIELGMEIFNQPIATSSGTWQCSSCHSVDAARVRLVGPGLYAIGSHDVERIEESGAGNVVEYILVSIVEPQAYITPGDDAGPYPENLMPQNYGDVLSEEELDALTAYIYSLGSE
ncbi:MAG: cytochrome c [Chloroflexota bacterium]